jgi:peptidyl-prolyl cis-trans isomerase SurA
MFSYLLLLFLPFLSFAQQQPPDRRVLFDGILAAVYGPMQTDIITYSDVQRPGIDGSKRTIDGLMDRTLKDQDAQRYGMKSTPDAVDKQLQIVFRGNNWTEEDFNKMVQTMGWLPEEAREEFRLITDVNQIENFKILGQLIVPERDVLAYYQANPEYELAEYLIERAVIPYDFSGDRTMQRAQLNQEIKNNRLEVEWPEPFWISDQDIADDKAFIRTLSFNEISEPQEIGEGFEIMRVLKFKEKKLKTLEEMHNQIVEILRRPKAEEMQKNYSESLRANATIVYFDEEVAEQMKMQSKGE